MSKKRKATPQSSTLLDFFGKGSSTAGVRDTKKPRVKTVHHKPTVKHEPSEEVIVIDSDDDVVEVTPVRPAPKPVPTATATHAIHSAPGTSSKAESGSETTVLGDLSAPVCSSSKGCRADGRVPGPIVKSEPNITHALSMGSVTSVLPACNDNGSREPSPFGFPDMLAPIAPEHPVMPVPPVSGPSGLPDCSHDGASEGAITHNPNGSTEEDIAGDSDWDMGDDEMELLDVESQVKTEDTQTVDIDLTLDDDLPSTAEEQPVETCPICEKELAGFNAAVRLPCPHPLGSGVPDFCTGDSRPCRPMSECSPRHTSEHHCYR